MLRVLHSLMIGCVFLALVNSFPNGLAQESPSLDRQQFRSELLRLAEICDRLKLEKEAEISRQWLDPDRTDLHRLYLPTEFPRESGKKENDSWRLRFIAARKQYAENLFSLATSQLADDEAAAYRLLWQVVRENPEHAEAKRILGPLLLGLSVRPQQKAGIKVPELAASGVVPRWQTLHFQLYSRATAKESMALLSQLERIHVLWTQFFYELWAPPGILAKRMAGGNNEWPDNDRMEVMLLANRQEYLQLLGVAEDNIGISVGYYNPIRKLSVYYQTEELNETVLHETTHQLFSESSSMRLAPVLDKVEGAWSIEGVALYMESLRQAGEGWIIGGTEVPRVQTARYRALRDEHWALWDPFCKGSLQEWKSASDIAVSYSHAAGLTHLFLDNLLHEDSSRSTYLNYLRSVYEGSQANSELFEILGGAEQAAQLNYRRALTITDQQLQLLAQSPESVKQLVMCRSKLQDWSVLDQFKSLQWLDVSYTDVTNETAKWLSSLTKLQRLSIEGTKLDGASMEEIAKLRALTELDLSLCSVDDAGLAWLINHPKLETLYLTGTKVTEKSLATLGTLSKLKKCDVTGTVITKDSWEAFVAKNPRLKSPQ